MLRKKHYLKHGFCILIQLLFCLFCLGQNYTVETQEFGVNDGLLHRNVLSVFEDDEDFIWLGTSKGIQRYDGHEFKSWTKQHGSGKIFEITTIGQDNAGWLWLWNNHLYEFVFLNTLTEEVQTQQERFGDDFPVKRLSDNQGWNNYSSYLLTDSKGRLCFVSAQPNEIIFYDSTKGFETVPISNLEYGFYNLKFIDSHDCLWVEEKKKETAILHKFSITGELLNSFPFNTSESLNCFSENNGDIYFQQSLRESVRYILINESGQQEFVFSKPYEIESLGFFSMNGLFWDLNSKGWQIFSDIDKERESLLQLNKEDYSKRFFNRLTSFYQDRRGGVWLMGRWGLARIKLYHNLFQKYFHFEDGSIKPINNSARGIVVDGENVYANFEFGALVRIKKNRPDQWSITNSNDASEAYYGRPLIKNNREQLINGHPNHLRIVDISSNTPRKIGFDTLLDRPILWFWSLYQEDQNIWGGLSNGLAFLGANENNIEYIGLGDFKGDSDITTPKIYQIQKKDSQNFWLCGSKGLILFDKIERKVVERYSSNGEGKFHLPISVAYYLYIDEDGIYWLGTDEGLLRWDKTKNEQRLFTTIDGLSNNVIYAVFEDDFDQLWLSSDYGIIQFDKESFQVRSYLPKDGISHHEFNKTAAFQEKNGTIYFGGLNGITSFNPADFYKQEEEQPFKMALSKYEIFDGAVGKIIDKSGELKVTNSIVFRPDDRFFRLSFSLLSMEDSDRVSYAWRVEGVDEQWNYQKSNTIQIGKLPYGTHRLFIKGQNSGGQWSAHQLDIELNILRPFYLTYTFFGLLLLGVVLCIWLYNRYRRYHFDKEQKILEEKISNATVQIRNDKLTIEKQSDELRHLDEIKSRFFANVSHELRTPLTLIMGPLNSVLKRDRLDVKDAQLLSVARQSSNDLLKLVGSILDLSKMEAGKIELKEEVEPFFELMRRLTSAFESHAQRKGIRFLYQYEAKKDLQLLIDKDKLEVVVNNLLANAIKFTPSKGTITVSIKDLENTILLLVKDTGKGIHEDDIDFVFDRFYQSKKSNVLTEGGTRIGLALSQEYAKLMNGTLIVESTWGEGSTFCLSIPRKEVLGQMEGFSDELLNEYLKQEQQIKQNYPIVTSKTSVASNSRILIVEDNHSLRNYLESIITPNYEVVLAENGLEALSKIGSEKFDLVLSDIMMPIMDGYELLERLKTNDKYSHIPVVMLTARADVQDKLRALRIGVDDYLLKPFDEEELLVRIENLLENASMRKVVSSKTGEDENLRRLFSQEDREWLENCEKLLRSKLGERTYSIATISHQLSMSESTLTRQLKRLTGMTPAKYFQEMRLSESRKLLETRQYNTVSQVAYCVGFSDSKAFSKSFKRRYGSLPSEILRQSR